MAKNECGCVDSPSVPEVQTVALTDFIFALCALLGSLLILLPGLYRLLCLKCRAVAPAVSSSVRTRTV